MRKRERFYVYFDWGEEERVRLACWALGAAISYAREDMFADAFACLSMADGSNIPWSDLGNRASAYKLYCAVGVAIRFAASYLDDRDAGVPWAGY